MENKTALQLKEQSTDLIAILTDITDVTRMSSYERGLSIKKIIQSSIPIVVLIQQVGRKTVKQVIDLHLSRLIKSLNTKYNMNDDQQIKFLVEDLLDKYSNESLDDFILVFRRARMGGFKNENGDSTIYGLDSPTVFRWMEIYFNEKYDALVAQLNDEKDNPYQPVRIESPSMEKEIKIIEQDPDLKPIIEEAKQFNDDPEKKHQHWINQLKKVTAPVDSRKIPPMSPEDIRREGQKKAVSKTRPYTPKEYEEKMDLHRKWIFENYDPKTGDKKKKWISEEEWLKKKK